MKNNKPQYIGAYVTKKCKESKYSKSRGISKEQNIVSTVKEHILKKEIGKKKEKWNWYIKHNSMTTD